jgi:hypothetical protein
MNLHPRPSSKTSRMRDRKVRILLMTALVWTTGCVIWAMVDKGPGVATALPMPDDELWMERRAEEARVKALVPEAQKAPKGTVKVSFASLAYALTPEQEQQGEHKGYAQWAPASVKALDGRHVRIEGFMLPMRVKDGKVTECLIMANQLSCCFGQPPRFCDFIAAKATGDPVPMVQDQVLVYEGTLHVADVFEGTIWTSLYSLDLDSVGR